MRDEPLRPARVDELAAVYNAVGAARLFLGREAFDRFFAEGPWRVQVTDAGEAVVLDRWRAHLDLLAVLGLWCAERRIAPLMRAAHGIALAHGYAALLSPVVPDAYAQPYLDAGMRVRERTVTMSLMRLDRRAPRHAPLPADVTLRPAGEADVAALLAADARIFEPFWRCDAPTMARGMADGRVVLAEAAGAVVGYTQAAVREREGLLGRLGVVPEQRGCGIGAALLEAALADMASRGATLATLCTQEDNAASRALYAHAGFEAQPGTSVLLTM